ncbi:MAG: hypothetical protein ACLRZ9_02165 [Eubacterium sp.]
MKKYIKKMISVIISLTIVVSMISANSFKANGAENMIEETEEKNAETVKGVNETVFWETETDMRETVISETDTKETVASETKNPEIVTRENGNNNYSDAQNRVINQVKGISENTQDYDMEKVKELYQCYSVLTEQEIQQLPSDTVENYVSILDQAAEINHRDGVTGIGVDAKDLPWYVKVVAEKTDESKFQEKYDSYLDSLYDEEDIDEEDEDENSDEENWDDDDWSDTDEEDEIEDEDMEEDTNDDNQNDDDVEHPKIYYGPSGLGYRADDERLGTIASSYKISLYDIMEEKDYSVPEGMTVKVFLPYIREYLGYDLEVVHMKSDDVFESLFPMIIDKNSIENSEEDNQQENTIDDGPEDDNDEDVDHNDYDIDKDSESEMSKEEYKEWVEEENSKIDVEEYNVLFTTDSFSEFGVRLIESEYAETTAVSESSRAEMISPKTGLNLELPIIIALSSGMLAMVSLVFYRKRDEDIV